MAWHEVKKAAGLSAAPNTNRGFPTRKELTYADAIAKALGPLKACDARSVWAQVSKFAGFAKTPGKGNSKLVPVAVEVKRSASASERLKIAAAIRLRGIYVANPTGWRFWTGVASVGSFAALSNLPGVAGWRIGLENIPGVSRKKIPFNSIGLAWAGAPKNRPLIGIIDHGIAVAHPSFRYPAAQSEPRLISLWDQDPDRLSSKNNPTQLWQVVQGLGYGGELTRVKLKALIAANGGRDSLIYEELKYKPALGHLSHGTHVLDLAAGSPNPLANATHPASPEAVSDSPIVAVQLPYIPARDSSGSALCVHVLDALHYIVSKSKLNQKVVINLSDGAYGGPHDGLSMLERAIDDFLGNRPNVTLVLAAGNALDSRGHARVAALKKGESVQFDWRILPDDYTDSFLEVWFDRVCANQSVTLTVTPPNDPGSVTVTMGSNKVLSHSSGYSLASVISLGTNPDGPKRSMFLVAVAPTNPKNKDFPAAPHGLWKVKVSNIKLAADVAVDAWIERDNPVFTESGPRRQSFFEDRHCNPLVVTGQGTLGSLAGSGQAIVVGGRYRRGSASVGCEVLPLSRVAKYSSRGPGRAGPAQGPDLLGPSDDSPVELGLLAAANRTGAKFRMDGTSVAAPIVTRRIVNLLGAPNPPAGRPAILAALTGPNGPASDPDLTGEKAYVEPGLEPQPAASGGILGAKLSKLQITNVKATRGRH